jgi:hypothetical protein
MAKITGPLMSMTASGLVGARLVFSNKKTGQQVRFQRSNIDANSFDQKTNRAVYQDAVAEWNLLSAAEKKVWKDQAVGRSLTGFNLFIQDYYMNTIRKLATITNIDLKVVIETPFYTVPTGSKLVITSSVVKLVSFDTPTFDGTYSLKRGLAGPQMFLYGGEIVHNVNESYVAHVFAGDIFTGLVMAAGEIVYFSVDGADSGIAFTVDIDLFGYLIEA